MGFTFSSHWLPKISISLICTISKHFRILHLYTTHKYSLTTHITRNVWVYTNLSYHICTTFKSVLWKRSHHRVPANGHHVQQNPSSDDIWLNLQDIQPILYPELSSWTPMLLWSYSSFWWTPVSWSISILWIQYGSTYFIAA